MVLVLLKRSVAFAPCIYLFLTAIIFYISTFISVLFLLSSFSPSFSSPPIPFALFLNWLSVKGRQQGKRGTERKEHLWPNAEQALIIYSDLQPQANPKEMRGGHEERKRDGEGEKWLCCYWQSLDTALNYLKLYSGLKALKQLLPSIKNRIGCIY